VVRAVIMLPGDVVYPRAGMVHRVNAVRKTSLLEVSTPELDDVIRIEDDAGRRDGWIASEHDY
jgi:mannose-6-phosphate isomerase